MKRLRLLILSVIALGALALAAGLASHTAQADQAPAPSTTEYVVHMKNYAFVPATLTVPVGATVTFQNDDAVSHTAQTKNKDGFNSGNMDQGATFKHTFTKAGRFDYICAYHPNMTGTVIVSENAASPTPFVPPSPSGY